jgi:hypothetical protein
MLRGALRLIMGDGMTPDQEDRIIREADDYADLVHGVENGTMTARQVDLQFFPVDGEWVKPEGAVRCDLLMQGGGAGGGRWRAGEDGELTAACFAADEVPDRVLVEVGAGGRSADGGADGAAGYVLVVTHVADD